MRGVAVFGAVILLACSTGFAQSREKNPQEQAIVNSYLKKVENKHTRKLGWFSVNGGLNRIFRDNDYNKFVDYPAGQFVEGKFNYLNMANSIGADFALMISRKIGWHAGGEYWLTFGNQLSGTYTYNPPGGGTAQVTDPKSEISVVGFHTGLQYYVLNPPTPQEKLSKLAVRVNGAVGMYSASWDLFNQFQNLNLATSAPASTNTTFKDDAIGFRAGVGIDYPVKLGGLTLSLESEYLSLNFNEMAWYNQQNNEIIASYDGTSNGRVGLDLSGLRGRFEIKKFFSW